MSTTPSEPGSRTSYNYPGGGVLDVARLPIPGNAEFLVYVIVLIIFALIAIFDDQVSGDRFVWGATWVSAAYLLSRGIAKASRVLEQ
jgi:hypothetical protein